MRRLALAAGSRGAMTEGSPGEGPLDFLFLGRHDLSTLAAAHRTYARVRDGGTIAGFRDAIPPAELESFFNRFGRVVQYDDDLWSMSKTRVPISYIIPAYDCDDTIAESVESIAAQSPQDGDEIVIVNDASPGRTGEILDELQRRYDFVRVFAHKRNRGGAAARNTAVENAKNPLIFCLDSDNVLEPNSVARLAAFLDATGSDAAAFQQLRYFDAKAGDVTHTWSFKPGVVEFADALASFVVPPSSGNYLFTADSWARAGSYPEFAGALDAWGFGVRQLATGTRMTVLPDTWYHHRHGHESYWNRFVRNRRVSIVALQIVLPFLDRFDDDDVAYILGPGRETWFDNLAEHPIRLKSTQHVAAGGTVTRPARSLRARVRRFARRFL